MSNSRESSRRAFLRRSLGSAAALLSPSMLSAAIERRGRPPNVLFIITDDQPLDAFGCLGGQALGGCIAVEKSLDVACLYDTKAPQFDIVDHALEDAVLITTVAGDHRVVIFSLTLHQRAGRKIDLGIHQHHVFGS